MRRLLIWSGLDEWRAEIAHVDTDAGSLVAGGTQIGIAYELRYELTDRLLRPRSSSAARPERSTWATPTSSTSPFRRS